MERELPNVSLNNCLRTSSVIGMQQNNDGNPLNNKANIYNSGIQCGLNLSNSSMCEYQNLTTFDPSLRPVHAEVCVSPYNCEEFTVIESYVVEFLRQLGPRHIPTVLNKFDNELSLVTCNSEVNKFHQVLTSCVASINVS